MAGLDFLRNIRCMMFRSPTHFDALSQFVGITHWREYCRYALAVLGTWSELCARAIGLGKLYPAIRLPLFPANIWSLCRWPGCGRAQCFQICDPTPRNESLVAHTYFELQPSKGQLGWKFRKKLLHKYLRLSFIYTVIPVKIPFELWKSLFYYNFSLVTNVLYVYLVFK